MSQTKNRPFAAARAAMGVYAVLVPATLAACAGTSEKAGPSDGDAGYAAEREKGSTGSSGSPFAIVGGERVGVPAIEMGDARTVSMIVKEGRDRSQVMDHLEHLTGEFGARLTASSALESANRWAADRFTEWGLSNVELSEWGEAGLRFDRGPSTGLVVVDGGEGSERALEFTTLAWTRGTDGPVRGPVMKMPVAGGDEGEGFDASAFEGAWVLLTPQVGGRQGIRGTTGSMAARTRLREDVRAWLDAGPAVDDETVAGLTPFGGAWSGTITGPYLPEGGEAFELRVGFEASGRPIVRAGASELSVDDAIEVDIDGSTLTMTTLAPRGRFEYTLTVDGDSMTGTGSFGGQAYEIELALDDPMPAGAGDAWREWSTLGRILAAGPAGFVSASSDERVWTSSPVRGEDLLALTPDDVASDIEINVRRSDYDHVNSRLADGLGVELEFDLDHTLEGGPIPLYNTFAEVTGSTFPDEVVIVSAHLDSWNGPGSTGTVDNGTGSAVTIEAARILSEVLAAGGTAPARTIRFALWTGEEQGLMGSRAYVATLGEDELSKISAVFVDDGGTNSEGGLPAADFMVDYLAAATAPTNGVFTSDEHAEWALTDDEPWNDDGFINVNVRPTGDRIQTHGGSDHAAFNDVGVPGFFWDEVGRANYWEAWHTQHDTIDQAVPEYLRQSATNMAITAYNLACAPGLLPREGSSSGEAESEDSIETQIGVRE
ncbi:MAG: M28 family peptidase [Planctomycetota bacterium]